MFPQTAIDISLGSRSRVSPASEVRWFKGTIMSQGEGGAGREWGAAGKVVGRACFPAARKVVGSAWFRHGLPAVITVAVVVVTSFIWHRWPSERTLGILSFPIAFIALVWTIPLIISGEIAVGRLSTIASHISTSSAGLFPDHLEAIAELVSRAQNGGSVDILADCFDYGSFHPELHQRVMNELVDACRKRQVKLRWLVVGPPNARTVAIGSETADAKSNNALKHYLSVLRSDESFRRWLVEKATSSEELKKAIEFINKGLSKEKQIKERGLMDFMGALKNFLKGGDDRIFASCKRKRDILLMFRQWYFVQELEGVHAITRHLPDSGGPAMFIWLRDDDQEAVFMVVDPEHHQANAAVRTRDHELIGSLRLVFDHEWRRWEKEC